MSFCKKRCVLPRVELIIKGYGVSVAFSSYSKGGAANLSSCGKPKSLINKGSKWYLKLVLPSCPEF
jgi:hypothetical protein